MQRRHDIDALRVIAFALLILYHSAMVYVAEWDFHIKSTYLAEWLQWPMIALNRWRMPLLFTISGIALGLAGIEAKRRRFAASRSLRLLVPLLFGMFVVVAPQAYFEGRANGHLPAGFGAFMVSYWQVHPWPEGSFSGWQHGITWNHLWYLAYLWPYTLLLLVLSPALRTFAERLSSTRHRTWRAVMLLLAPPAWLLAGVLWIAPRYPETHALVGDWTVHAESLPLFLLGYVLARNAWFWNWVRGMRWSTLVLAIVAIGIELGLRWFGRHPPTGPIPDWMLSIPWYGIERSARAVYTWMALLALFGWGRALLNRPFRWLPYCSEAVFSWYILHQTLIVALAYWLVPRHLGPIVEPLLVVAGTILGCLALHELLIRRIGWLRPLFGLKPARKGAQVPDAPPPTGWHPHPGSRQG